MTDPARRPRRLRRIGAVLLAVILLGVAALVLMVAIGRPAPDGAPRASVPRAERAPEGVRVRVEVLNATATRGLARRATIHLRDRGFDVVYFGTASKREDTTLVLDRSGHADWAAAVRAALAAGRVETRPDSSRYLDVTVLLGADWRPPPEPFNP